MKNKEKNRAAKILNKLKQHPHSIKYALVFLKRENLLAESDVKLT